MEDTGVEVHNTSLPSRMEWREEWIPGITIDGVWVSCSILDELADRPRNTDVTAQDPCLPLPDVKNVLVKYGLATPQTRGGVYAGSAFQEFWDKMEFTRQPAKGVGWI